jgi:hypothetical protein
VLNRDTCNEWLDSLNVTDGMICAGYPVRNFSLFSSLLGAIFHRNREREERGRARARSEGFGMRFILLLAVAGRRNLTCRWCPPAIMTLLSCTRRGLNFFPFSLLWDPSDIHRLYSLSSLHSQQTFVESLTHSFSLSTTTKLFMLLCILKSH